MQLLKWAGKVIVGLAPIAALSVTPNNAEDIRFQAGIERGERITKESKALGELGKQQNLNFGGVTLLLRATVLNLESQVAFDVAEHRRRRVPFSLETEKEAVPVNQVMVFLEANSGGLIPTSGKYRSAAAYIYLTLDGKQVQPKRIIPAGATLPLDRGDWAHGGDYKTYFVFDVPNQFASASMTVIGADGKEKTRDFSPDLLR